MEVAVLDLSLRCYFSPSAYILRLDPVLPSQSIRSLTLFLVLSVFCTGREQRSLQKPSLTPWHPLHPAQIA